MDQPKIERLLKLMVMLVTNCHLTKQQIADRLGICPRTVGRYLDSFKCANFVVVKNGEYYSLDRSSPFLKELSEMENITEVDAVVLCESIEAVDNPNTVKPNLKKKLAARFHKRLMAEVTVNQKIAQHIKVLSEAIMEKKQVMLYDYASADSNSISPRLVEPYKFTTNYTDVWAYELSTNSNEIFRISRIGRVDLLQHFWDFEALHGAEFIDMFGIPGSSKQPIELILNVRSSFILQEEYPKSADYLKEIDHEHWLLETEVCSFLGIGRFVLGLMDDIEVIEPKEFVQFLKERLKNSQKKLKK